MWPARLSLSQRRGQEGEQQALAYLQKHGLELVEANFSCKAGEIDLIMRERGTLAFPPLKASLPPRSAASPAPPSST